MPFGELLERLRVQNTLVDIRRDGMSVSDLRGTILALSKRLVLVAIVGDDVKPNGYAVINRGDVTFLRWGTDVHRGWARALGDATRGDPVAREIDLTDWRNAIESARVSARLLTFHRDRADSDRCYIAKTIELTRHLVIGEQVTTEGEEDGSFAILLDDLTSLEFGGRYERALEQMLGTV